MSNERRVLMVVTTLGKWGEISGVAYRHQNYLRYFMKHAVPVDVITYGPRDDYEVFDSVRVITHQPRIPVKVDIKLKIDLIAGLSDLTRRISFDSYSIIHNAAPDGLGIMALNVAKKYNYPVVSIYHTALDEHARLRMEQFFGSNVGWASAEIMQRLLRWHYNQSDLVLALSRCSKDELKKKYSPRVEILGNGVDTDEFSPSRRRRKYNRVEVVYIGRVAPEKNLDILPEVFNGLKNIHFKIVGDGPYLKELKRKLPHAKFTGALFGEKLSRAYADADIFIYPSQTETFGNAILQSLASGVPVVVMDKMAAHELVQNGKTGFVCSNVSEFRSAIKKLADDENLRHRFGTASRQYALTQGLDKACEQLLQYYNLAAEIHAGKNNSQVSESL